MSKIKNMKLRYKIGLGVASTAAVVAAGGAAFAYFTDTTTNTNGSATAGKSTPWSVGDPVVSGDAFFPTSYLSPSSFDTMTAVVRNVGSGHQGLNNLIVTLTGVTQETSPPAGGCALGNFQIQTTNSHWAVTGTHNGTATYALSTPLDVQDGHYVGLTSNVPSDSSASVANSLPTGLEIVLVNDPSAAQDGCQGATVQFSLTAN